MKIDIQREVKKDKRVNIIHSSIHVIHHPSLIDSSMSFLMPFIHLSLLGDLSGLRGHIGFRLARKKEDPLVAPSLLFFLWDTPQPPIVSRQSRLPNLAVLVSFSLSYIRAFPFMTADHRKVLNALETLFSDANLQWDKVMQKHLQEQNDCKLASFSSNLFQYS